MLRESLDRDEARAIDLAAASGVFVVCTPDAPAATSLPLTVVRRGHLLMYASQTAGSGVM